MIPLCALAALVASGAADAEVPETDSIALPESATVGSRDLDAVAMKLKRFVHDQPYGKTYRALAKTTPAPRDRTGQSQAKTHPDLQNDPIEMQAQVQFLKESGTETKFGRVSVRGVWVFHYGRLAGVQLAVDRIGRDAEQEAMFAQDLAALKKAWRDPAAALGINRHHRLVRNDLVRAKSRLPLIIQFERSPGRTK